MMHPSFFNLLGVKTQDGFIICNIKDVFDHASQLLTLPADREEERLSQAALSAIVDNTRALNRIELKQDAGWQTVRLNPEQDFIMQMHRDLTFA